MISPSSFARLILLGCCLTASAQPAVAAEGRPNVVLFLVDDMGWMDCGTYGSRYYETPHIDRLAAQGSIAGDVLRVTGTGRRPFIARVRFRESGPLELRVRLRSETGGEVAAQWRTADQETFPDSGQTATAMLQGGDWQDVRLRLDEKHQVAHLRLYLPAQKAPVEVDRIELWRTGESPERLVQWDFVARASAGK